MSAANLVFVNGNILALVDSRPRAKTVAIRDGRIAAGGSDSPVDRLEPLQGIHNAVNR